MPREGFTSSTQTGQLGTVQWGHMYRQTGVALALNNRRLMDAHWQHQANQSAFLKLARQHKLSLEGGGRGQSEKRLAAAWDKCGRSQAHLAHMEAQPYRCTSGKAFITFEFERGRNKALLAAAEGKLPPLRGEHRLHVKVAPEPADILWGNVGIPRARCLLIQTFMALLAIGYIIAISRFMAMATRFQVSTAKEYEGRYFLSGLLHPGMLGCVAVILCNVLTIVVLMPILSSFECHHTRTELQIVTFMKLALFQFLNTAATVIVVFGIPSKEPYSIFHINYPTTPAEEWGIGVGGFLAGLLIGDIALLNTLDSINPAFWAPLKLEAPKATSQQDMNTIYEGADWMIYLRYQFVLKFLFVGLCFCHIANPNILLLVTAFCFWQSYALERHNMVRCYKTPGHLDDDMQRTVLLVGLPCALVLHVVTGLFVYTYNLGVWDSVAATVGALEVVLTLVFLVLWWLPLGIWQMGMNLDQVDRRGEMGKLPRGMNVKNMKKVMREAQQSIKAVAADISAESSTAYEHSDTDMSFTHVLNDAAEDSHLQQAGQQARFVNLEEYVPTCIKRQFGVRFIY